VDGRYTLTVDDPFGLRCGNVYYGPTSPTHDVYSWDGNTLAETLTSTFGAGFDGQPGTLTYPIWLHGCTPGVREKAVSSQDPPPKGAAIFVANCLTRNSHLLTNNNALDTTAELLGVDSAQAVAKLAGELRGGDGRAQVITLALVLGATTARSRQSVQPSWSTPNPSRWTARNCAPFIPTSKRRPTSENRTRTWSIDQ
jgi:hypothetical protein